MKKFVVLTLSLFGILFSVSGCNQELIDNCETLDIIPSRIYGFELTVNNNAGEYHLFSSYEEIYTYFDENKSYENESLYQLEALKDVIEEEVDFSSYNLLAYNAYYSDSSMTYIASVDENNVTIYENGLEDGENASDVLCYEWIMIEVSNEYEYSELNVTSKSISRSERNCIEEEYGSNYVY